jgi:hypothetical protein
MTGENGSSTATVETLTAEVRVLIVGSRQVTLSVFRQLDEVHPEEIKPFGRVRSGRRCPFAVTGLIEVAGSAYGQLARSFVQYETWLCGSGGREGSRVTYNATDALCGYCSEHRGVAPSRPHVWYDHHDLYGEWEQLPLIVLAGLR